LFPLFRAKAACETSMVPTESEAASMSVGSDFVVCISNSSSWVRYKTASGCCVWVGHTIPSEIASFRRRL